MGNNLGNVATRLKDLARPTGEEERLPLAAHAPRLELSKLQALGVVLAVLVIGAVFYLGNRQPTEVVAPAGVGAVSTPARGGAATASASGAPASVVVAVVGDVPRPGLHTLAPEARVADAIAAASDRVDFASPQLGGINMAERLSDGQQVRVPYPGEPALPGEPVSAGEGKLNLNAASVEQLTALKGVGPKTAEAIITHRDTIGRFASVDQLLDVPGIGPAKLAGFKDEVTV